MTLKQLKPRKLPKQQRSANLVEAILQATARIFSKQASNSLSTNRIAEVAGVSIGSLYQYFPNKAAIVNQLIEREQTKMHTKILQSLKDPKDSSIDGAIQKIVDCVVEQFIDQKNLIAKLFVSAFQLEQVDAALLRRKHLIKEIEEVLKQHLSEKVNPERVGSLAFIITNATIGVLSVATIEGFVSLTADELKKELFHLIKGYLANESFI